MFRFVVGVGFAFVLAGVVLCFRNPDRIGAPLVAAVSGIITRFIGAAFMVIYRSTMGQANEFMAVLEHINTVDMAVQLLEGVKEAGTISKDQVRAQMATLLLSSATAVHKGGGRRRNQRAGERLIDRVTVFAQFAGLYRCRKGSSC